MLFKIRYPNIVPLFKLDQLLICARKVKTTYSTLQDKVTKFKVNLKTGAGMENNTVETEKPLRDPISFH